MQKFINKVLASLLFRISNSAEYQQKLNWKKNGELQAVKKAFRALGDNPIFPDEKRIIGAGHITIGNNFFALYNLRLEAIAEYCGQNFTPELVIGNDVNINSDCHIGCINRVTIGNNVLIASRVYISDHSHGDTTKEAITMAPAKRPLISQGPVIIEDNVWIGEGVCILPNVRIGKNAIIGANAVVTKDVPANCVAIGIPARVLREL